MRTWIMLMAMIISYTINPKIVFPINMGVFIIIGILIGFIVDIIEFLRGFKE